MKLRFLKGKTIKHGPPLKLPPLAPAFSAHARMLSQAERAVAEAVAVPHRLLKPGKVMTATEVLQSQAKGALRLQRAMEALIQPIVEAHAIVLERWVWRNRLRWAVEAVELKRLTKRSRT